MIYKNNYLSDVIIRVDFVSQEESLKHSLSSNVKNTCVRYFPVPETRQVETQQVVVSNLPGAQNTTVSKEQLTEWHFWGLDKEKELCITSTCLFINVKRYRKYEELKDQFFHILESFTTEYSGVRINRVGLRYINQISLAPEKRLRKSWHTYWSKYINESLVRNMSFPDNDSALARCMSSIEMNYGDHMLRFQYGAFNPDYPAPNKKNSFVLDIDVYTTGLIEISDVRNNVDTFHDNVITWFEKAIKADLRTKMGVEGSEE